VTHLPLPELETASPALAAEYAAARERGGSVMAIVRAMGPRVEVLRAFLDLADAALYGPAALGRRERDRALVAFATRLTLQPREAGEAVAALREHLSDDEVHDAIAVVGLLNLANRTALATGITEADDLR
jgi:alkylhydroperoxidase family enzyme